MGPASQINVWCTSVSDKFVYLLFTCALNCRGKCLAEYRIATLNLAVRGVRFRCGDDSFSQISVHKALTCPAWATAPPLFREKKLAPWFTHFQKCRWSTVCCFAGLLVGVALCLSRINFRFSWEDEYCVIIIVFVIVVGAAFVVVVGFSCVLCVVCQSVIGFDVVVVGRICCFESSAHKVAFHGP